MTVRTAARFLLSLFLLVFAGPASAQPDSMTESEKVVYSFFKLNDHTPAYEDWIINSAAWKSAAGDKSAQDEVFEKEMLRLKWNFGTFDPGTDFIKIRTPVRLLLQGNLIAFVFPGADHGEVPYFPFPYAKEWIALVVNDLDPLLELELTPEEKALAEKTLPRNTSVDGEVVLHIRAAKADNTEQLVLHGIKHWMLIGETGNFTLSSGGKALTSYTAPWYLETMERKKELESLKSGSAPLLAQ